MHIQRCQGIRKASEADLLKAKSNARDLRALKEKVSAVRATEQQLAELHKARSLLDDEFATLEAVQKGADKQVYTHLHMRSQRLTESFVRGYMCTSLALHTTLLFVLCKSNSVPVQRYDALAK